MHFSGAIHREPARKRMQLIPLCLFFPVWSLQGLLQPLHCPPPNQVGSHFRNKKPRIIFCFVCNLWRSFRSEINGKFQVQVARIRPLPRLPVVILDYRHLRGAWYLNIASKRGATWIITVVFVISKFSDTLQHHQIHCGKLCFIKVFFCDFSDKKDLHETSSLIFQLQ